MAVSVHLCIYEIAPTSPVLDRTRHGIPQPLTDSRPLTPPTPLPSLSPLPTQRQIKSDFDWPGLAWTALGAGLDWTGLDWTGLGWTGLDWAGLDWTELSPPQRPPSSLSLAPSRATHPCHPPFSCVPQAPTLPTSVVSGLSAPRVAPQTRSGGLQMRRRGDWRRPPTCSSFDALSRPLCMGGRALIPCRDQALMEWPTLQRHMPAHPRPAFMRRHPPDNHASTHDAPAPRHTHPCTLASC